MVWKCQQNVHNTASTHVTWVITKVTCYPWSILHSFCTLHSARSFHFFLKTSTNTMEKPHPLPMIIDHLNGFNIHEVPTILLQRRMVRFPLFFTLSLSLSLGLSLRLQFQFVSYGRYQYTNTEREIVSIKKRKRAKEIVFHTHNPFNQHNNYRSFGRPLCWVFAFADERTNDRKDFVVVERRRQFFNIFSRSRRKCYCRLTFMLKMACALMQRLRFDLCRHYVYYFSYRCCRHWQTPSPLLTL